MAHLRTWWGVTAAVIVALFAYTIATEIALAIIGTVYFSILVAIILPITFLRVRFDSAIASGPLATVVRD